MTIKNGRAYAPLRVLIPLDDALYNEFEKIAQDDYISHLNFSAYNIQLSPEKGVILELSGGIFRFVLDNWGDAWQALNLEKRVYEYRDITQRMILDLLFFKPSVRHGQRGLGKTDKEIIGYLINLVHLYRLLIEQEQDRSKPVSMHEAATAVACDIESKDPRFPYLTPDDGDIPWPPSWTRAGTTPETDRGVERLRKRAARTKPVGY